ncbi:MAG: Clp protease ClpP [Ruminococcus sp.]|nr:Clp protease ClpP [Ruminococcus sp.]
MMDNINGLKGYGIRMCFELNEHIREADLYIYDDIKSDDVDFLTGETVPSETDEKRICDKLSEIPDNYLLNVYIASNGGSVKTGLAIYSMLKRKACRKRAYIDGVACSIASVIPMACEEVIMYPTSLMMIHAASGLFMGTADEHRAFAEELDVITESAAKAYLDKAGEKLDENVLREMLKKDTWLNAEQCLGYGLCDRIESKAEKREGTPHGQAAMPSLNENTEKTAEQTKKINAAAVAAAFINSI